MKRADTTDTIKKLRKFLAHHSLPGASAQGRLAPSDRKTDRENDSGARSYREQPRTPRTQSRAAVLILLYPMSPPFSKTGAPITRKNRLHLPLILRPNDGTPHAGQISLPGGRHEGDEEFPVETALRETQEELGIHPSSLDILGSLSPLHVRVSEVTVTPVVAYTGSLPEIIPDPKEVADYFHAPLDAFLSGVRLGSFDTRGTMIEAPYYPTAAGRVWGATAMILAEFIEIYSAARRESKEEKER